MGGGNLVEITYSEIKALANGSQLIPGCLYRITDYVTKINGVYDLSAVAGQTAYAPYCKSAEHAFDLIVTAIDESTLDEHAVATQHEGDTYFANNDLEAWDIKYTIENDPTKYMWADATNGKGVIFHMRDEYGNEAGYDFKNLLVLAYALTGRDGYEGDLAYDASKQPKRYGSSYAVFNVFGEYLESGSYAPPFDKYDFAVGANILGIIQFSEITDTFLTTFNAGLYYTFDVLSSDLTTHTDGSLNNSYGRVIGNVIEPCTDVLYTFLNRSSSPMGLNCTIFENFDVSSNYRNAFNHISGNAYMNIFGDSCFGNDVGEFAYGNVFGNECNSNTFGDSCNSNTLGSGCEYNIFKANGKLNTFGRYCFYNTFGSCSSNVFGDNCNFNTFGDGCESNRFGNSCGSNIFGDGCGSNTFGGGCGSNTFKSSCYSNIFGDGCNFNTFEDGCDSNTFGIGCTSNTFGFDCGSNTFDGGCHANTFGDDCTSNTFGDSCSSNIFKSRCDFNTFGMGCDSNTFGNGCESNTFGNQCNSNTFGEYCSLNRFEISCTSNTFKNSCNSNTFGANCNSNTFGVDCDSNTFGEYCSFNTFGNSCGSNIFKNNCHSNIFGVNCNTNTFENGCTSNTFGINCYRITFEGSCNYNTFGNHIEHLSYDQLSNKWVMRKSNDQIQVFNPADLVQHVVDETTNTFIIT